MLNTSMHSLSGFSALRVPLPGDDWHAFASKVPSCQEAGAGTENEDNLQKSHLHERAARAAVSACLHNMLYLVRTVLFFIFQSSELLRVELRESL